MIELPFTVKNNITHVKELNINNNPFKDVHFNNLHSVLDKSSCLSSKELT